MAASRYRSSRPTRRPTGNSRRRQQNEPDPVALVVFVQIIMCCILISISYMAVQSENPVYQQTMTQFTQLMEEPVLDVFGYQDKGVVLYDGEKDRDFGYNYIEKFFGQFLYLQETDLPQGGLFSVWGKTRNELLAPPDGMDLSPVAISFPLYMPVEGRITSIFGYREHPTTENLDFHTGLDIAADYGTPIRTALPGTVYEVGESDIYGNYIVLDHGNGVMTRYCHCQVVTAREGMILRQGEMIAKVGSTGMSTGPHLHFEVWVDDVLTDPLWVLYSVWEVNR